MKPEAPLGETLSSAAAIAILGTPLCFVFGPTLNNALIDLARVMGGLKQPRSVNGLEELGSTRLSKSAFMRDFLFSDIATMHGLANVPDDPELAVSA